LQLQHLLQEIIPMDIPRPRKLVPKNDYSTQKFCPTCGTGVMAIGKGNGINVSHLCKITRLGQCSQGQVRTLIDVNPFSLEIKE
jgi:hypothetical protein